MTGALLIVQLQLSPLPTSSFGPIKSRMETFWYQIAWVVKSTSVCAELQMITLLVCQSPAGSVVVIVSDPCLELALDACCV